MNNCQSNCGCKFEVDSSCVRYTAVNLGTTLINVGDTIETTIIKIDQAITNLQQTIINNSTNGSPLQISGPINNVVKFGPPSNPLLPSQTIDDGTSIGINATPDSSSKVLIETSANQSGLKVSSLNNGKEAITASSQAVGSIINKGIISFASGSTTSNIGVETSTTGSANINVGISASAFGATNNYSAQLRDGSETTTGGKFLKDTGSGKANWNYIYLSDIQDYQAPNQYALPIATSTILGGIKVGNGLSITNQGVLSSNIGQGTLNYIAKFTPDGYSIDDSIMQDNGNSIGVGAAPNSQTKHYVYSLDKRIAGFAETEYTGGNPAIGFGARAKGTNSGENRGAEFEASNSTNSNIGIYVSASDANPYIGIFQDGSQTVEGGRVLRDTGNGYAKWSSIVTDVTHAQLVGYVNGSQLTPGTYYRITDYQTIYEQPDYTDLYKPVTTPIIKTGPTQPLIVLALKNNVLSEQAYQEAFPKDTIKYKLIYNTRVTNAPTKGRIYERVDEYNNRTDFDHRNVLFKRYEVNNLTTLDQMSLHYPFFQTDIAVETLAFNIEPSTYNNYIEGNWSSLNSGVIPLYNSYFDLPNIVIRNSSNNLKIGSCINTTIRDGFDSEIGVAIESYIKTIVASKISIINNSYVDLTIVRSYLGDVSSSVILGYGGGKQIRSSTINEIALGSFDIVYSDNYIPQSNPYALASIPIPQKYVPRAIHIQDIIHVNINYLGDFYDPAHGIDLINYRDGSKLYSGSSSFTPSITHEKIIIKDNLGNIVSEVAEIAIDAQGKVKFVSLGGSTNSYFDQKGFFKTNYDYFYFQTTTTNEIGKVPSNISEQVKFIPNINNYSDSDSFGKSSFYFSNSNITDMYNCSMYAISGSSVSSINSCKFGALENCNIGFLSNVVSKNRESRIAKTNIKRFYNVQFEEIHNCYFKGLVRDTIFGAKFGSSSFNYLPDFVSSDEFIHQTQNQIFINPKTLHFTGNIFNGDIYGSTFGDYVYSNVFNCTVKGINVPDHFVNNEVNIVPTIKYFSYNLNIFNELKEKSIKCKINPVFNTFSELSMPTSVGTTYEYSQNESQGYYKLYAKVFNIESNYIDTIPRIWFVIDNEKIALYPVPDPYDRQSYLGGVVEKPSQYSEPNYIQPKAYFSYTNELVGNTSTLVGKSIDNIDILRKRNYLYYSKGKNIASLIDYISEEQSSSYGINGNESPNLDKITIPTKGDLELIYSLNLIQRNDIVWSSSEIDANNAWAFDFTTGQSVSRPKNTPLAILPVISSIGVNTMEIEYKRNSGIVTKPFPVNV